MNVTTRINSINNFANNHIETNFTSVKSNTSNNNSCVNYNRMPKITTTTTHCYSNSTNNNNNNNNTTLQQSSSTTTSQLVQKQTVSSRECSSVAYSDTLTTMRLLGKELGALGSGEEARTKLMPTTQIKIISVNNGKSSSNNSNTQKNASNNSSNNNVDNNINKSIMKSATTTTTTTSGAKLDSSMLINSPNQLSTATATTTPARRQQQAQIEQKLQQQQQQQTGHMLSITRDLNQINLKSSLYAEQQVYNANKNSNNSKHNCRGNNHQQQQQHDVQNSRSTNVSSNNNKHNNAGNNNNKQTQQQQITSGNNNSRKDCVQANDNNKSENTHVLVNKMRILKNGDNNKNNSNGSNEPEKQQLQLITRTTAKNAASETNAAVSDKISMTTKVSAEKYATKTTRTTPTIERAKAKPTKQTLRKSFSTPASFKIADVAVTLSKSGCMIGSSNNTNTNGSNESHSQSVSKVLPQSEAVAALLSYKKSDSDGGGGDYNKPNGGGHVRGAATCTITATATSAVAASKVNFAPTPAIITSATQLAHTSIEALTTPAAAATTTTIQTHATTLSTSAQLASTDVVTRSQTVAQQDPQQRLPQHHHQQQQQQQQHQQQQHNQQSSTKTVKAKDNDNQVICGNKSISADGNVVVVASTTTTSATLPLSPVSFDFDLRFGCAHYKRRAMFVTPCCNKFYKCRFCHDENESHHFDRKTLTELICSECNTRQKVQEQCEACGTRFGKYTCLICNLFDDTDKKQYHCNGCGICRIGGAENFFHCKVCDMCLPIRLKIDGHRCVENISRSHCPVCLGDIHTSRIPCHIPDCGHLLHKTCFDQLLNSGHYTCPICQTSLIDMTALWEYLDAQAVSLPVPKKYENQRIHIFCNDCHKTSKTKFNFIGLKCMQCGAYNTTQNVKRRMSLVTDEPSSA